MDPAERWNMRPAPKHSAGFITYIDFTYLCFSVKLQYLIFTLQLDCPKNSFITFLFSIKTLWNHWDVRRVSLSESGAGHVVKCTIQLTTAQLLFSLFFCPLNSTNLFLSEASRESERGESWPQGAGGCYGSSGQLASLLFFFFPADWACSLPPLLSVCSICFPTEERLPQGDPSVRDWRSEICPLLSQDTGWVTLISSHLMWDRLGLSEWRNVWRAVNRKHWGGCCATLLRLMLEAAVNNMKVSLSTSIA